MPKCSHRGHSCIFGRVLPPRADSACGPQVNMPRVSGIGRKKKKNKTAAEVVVGVHVEAAAESEVPDKATIIEAHLP